MHIYINIVEKSRTARSDKNTNSCPKTCNKTVIQVKYYIKLIHAQPLGALLCPRPRRALLNSMIRPSVCLSISRRSCLAYRHAGCLQLSHRRPPDMCQMRTRPRTDVDPPRFLDRTAIGGRGISSRRPRADTLFCWHFVWGVLV